MKQPSRGIRRRPVKSVTPRYRRRRCCATALSPRQTSHARPTTSSPRHPQTVRLIRRMLFLLRFRPNSRPRRAIAGRISGFRKSVSHRKAVGFCPSRLELKWNRYSFKMATITLKNIPGDLHWELKKRAEGSDDSSRLLAPTTKYALSKHQRLILTSAAYRRAECARSKALTLSADFVFHTRS